MIDVGVCLLRGSETGGVGDGSGHDARHGRDGLAGDEMQGYRYAHAEQHHEEGEQVEPHSSALEAGEEAGADLQTYAVDEQYESEFLEELQQIGVEGHPEMAERDTDEQYPCHSEADAGDLDLAHDLSERDHEGQDYYGVRYSSAPYTFGSVEKSV